MKLKTLSAIIATISCVATLPANAVYNLYKKDGLSIDINGELNVQARNEREQFELQYDKVKSVYSQRVLNSAGTKYDYPTIQAGYYNENKDRRTRIGQDEGASWLEVRASQALRDGWRVSGTVGFGYWDSASGAYLSNTNLAVDKKGLGSISFGRQYLHNSYVTRTGTYTPLETYAGRSVRLDYTGTKNLHISAYYNTPSSSDVRNTNNDLEVEGWGASVSYKHPFASNQYLRVAAGYSDSRKNPTSTSRLSNQYAVDSNGVAASAEYRYNKFVAAADIGYKNENLNGTVTDKARTHYHGIKLGYEITPRFTATVGYGEKEARRVNNRVTTPNWVSGVTMSGSYDNMVLAFEPYIFDRVEEKRGYIRGDYYLRDNVRLYGRVEQSEQQTKFGDEDFGKLTNTDYRVGLSLAF